MMVKVRIQIRGAINSCILRAKHLKHCGGVGGGGWQPPQDDRTSDDSIRSKKSKI